MGSKLWAVDMILIGVIRPMINAYVFGQYEKACQLLISLNSFLKGYASVRHIPNYSDVVPLLLLSKAIATIGYTVKTKTWDNKNATLYQKHRKLLDTIV